MFSTFIVSILLEGFERDVLLGTYIYTYVHANWNQEVKAVPL